MPPTNLQRILENSSLNTATKRERIQAFIDGGGDLNALEQNGYTSLMNEMTYGTDETVNLLLDLGADVNVRSTKQNKSENALIISTRKTGKLSLETYKKIVDKTTDLNEKNRDEDTALMLFAEVNSELTQGDDTEKAAQVVEYLLQKGADPNIKDFEATYAALTRALLNNNIQAALHLAAAETLKINEPQNKGKSTYLIEAIKAKAIEVARILLDRGADPSSLTENRHTTPLITAVDPHTNLSSNKQKDFVRLLLDKGADKNVYNNLRMSAYDYAELEDVGEDLYSELKPSVMPPAAPSRRNTIYNLPQRYRANYNTNRNSNNSNNSSNNNNRTAIAHPPNHYTGVNNSANNNWEREEEENINEDQVFPVGEEARQITDAILATPSTPKEERIQVPLASGQTITVFDLYEASDVEVTKEEVEEDDDNTYFKVGATYSRFPNEFLQKHITNFSAIQFACKREMVLERDGTPKLVDVELDKPYYLIPLVGKYLVPLGELMWALESGKPRIFELVETDTTLPNVSSFSAIQKPYQQGNSSMLNYSGRRYNIVSKDHCTPGTQRRLFSLTQIEFVAPSSGGKRKQTRRHKHNNKDTKKSKAKRLNKRHRILLTRRLPNKRSKSNKRNTTKRHKAKRH